MTELYSKEERGNRQVGVDAVGADLRQFKKLQHLSNADVAFRMASSLNEVKKLRKMFDQERHPLYDTGIKYSIRVILGKYGIKTTGELLALSGRDRDWETSYGVS
jgi:hypothetical protein